MNQPSPIQSVTDDTTGWYGTGLDNKFVMQAGGTRSWYACIIKAQKSWDGDTSAAQKKSKLRQGTDEEMDVRERCRVLYLYDQCFVMHEWTQASLRCAGGPSLSVCLLCVRVFALR